MVKNSTAQVTAFIVLAVIIVLIAGLVIFFNQKSSLDRVFSRLDIDADAQQVQSSINSCIESTAKDALLIIGVQGGYYNKPDKPVYSPADWTFIPYYYYQGQYHQPSIETIQQEISSYVDDNLQTCIPTYNGFSIQLSKAQTQTIIEENAIKLSTRASLQIQKSSETLDYELENQPIVIESALLDILEVADYITESHKDDPENICISCITDMAQERNVYVDMINQETSSVLVVISENYTSSEPYVFEFMNRY